MQGICLWAPQHPLPGQLPGLRGGRGSSLAPPRRRRDGAEGAECWPLQGRGGGSALACRAQVRWEQPGLCRQVWAHLPLP